MNNKDQMKNKSLLNFSDSQETEEDEEQQA